MLEELQTVAYEDLAIRIGLAALFGCLLGLDRDMKNKPVDFRAFMIVCVSTCLVAILGQELYATYANQDGFISLDLGKIISGALTGVGFLGAGAILKNSDNNQVIGTATGASIWGSSIIGLCLGFGYITLATVGFIVIFAILLIIGCFHRLLSGHPDKEKHG
jgi:putative Mg2+ transporter-C (MgtC) family protein